MRQSLSYAILLGLFSLHGCSDRGQLPTGDVPKDQATPKDVVRKLRNAAIRGDEEAFQQCFWGEDARMLPVIQSQFKYVAAVYDVYRYVIEHHGVSGITAYQETTLEDGFGFKYAVIPLLNDKWADEAEFRQLSDSEAKITVVLDNGAEQKWRLGRKQSAWGLRWSDEIPPEETPQDWAEQFEWWAVGTRKGLSLAKEKGIVDLREIKRLILNEFDLRERNAEE